MAKTKLCNYYNPILERGCFKGKNCNFFHKSSLAEPPIIFAKSQKSPNDIYDLISLYCNLDIQDNTTSPTESDSTNSDKAERKMLKPLRNRNLNNLMKISPKCLSMRVKRSRKFHQRQKGIIDKK